MFDAFVRKNEDGTVSGLDFAELDEDTAGDLTLFNGASTGMLGNDDAGAGCAARAGSARGARGRHQRPVRTAQGAR